MEKLLEIVRRTLAAHPGHCNELYAAWTLNLAAAELGGYDLEGASDEQVL